ncbi:hypothetical protein QF028_002275 [Neobacillus sp. B4I6]
MGVRPPLTNSIALVTGELALSYNENGWNTDKK